MFAGNDREVRRLLIVGRSSPVIGFEAAASVESGSKPISAHLLLIVLMVIFFVLRENDERSVRCRKPVAQWATEERYPARERERISELFT